MLRKEWVFGLLQGVILGSTLTMFFLNDRVDQTLQHELGRWSSLLVFALIALVALDFVANRMKRERH